MGILALSAMMIGTVGCSKKQTTVNNAKAEPTAVTTSTPTPTPEDETVEVIDECLEATLPYDSNPDNQWKLNKNAKKAGDDVISNLHSDINFYWDKIITLGTGY